MLLCPSCQQPIPERDINIATDVALCRACNQTIAVSDIVHGISKQRAAFEKALPPPGAWFRDDGVETRIGATTRSPIAFILVPFMMVWSGGAIGGIYGTQVASGQFSLAQSLFGIPFLLGALLFWSVALMCIFGKVEVRLRNGEGAVFTGIGIIGWTKRFSISEITTVREDWTGHPNSRRSHKVIILEGARRVTLGTGLNEARRYFLLQTLMPLLGSRP